MAASLVLALGAAVVGLLLARQWVRARRARAAQPPPPHTELVVAAVAPNDAVAQLMHDQLQAAGIRAVLRNRDEFAPTRALGVTAPFSQEILVRAQDADRAASVLAAVQRHPAPHQPGSSAHRPARRR